MMSQPRTVLAEKQNVGRIVSCEHGCVHFQVGNVTMTFSRDAYMQLVDLVNTSAANFESLLDTKAQTGA